ncbi:hypothetical protein [Methanococcoides methylutens]|uniref:hypothetical protein n=1 Tax=Methanococcoides methylutens TaxID=2226 RepID=UPI000693DE16|nr:hypothetical protein [Methanococcoides methylutens]
MVSRKTLLIFILLFLVVISFPFWFTFFIAGSPTPLFSVSNYDNVSHTVAVEIIAPDNTSIFNDSRDLDSDEHWSHPKPLYMVPRSVFAWGEDRYTVYATLDNNVTKNMTINYHLWNDPSIEIYDGTLSIGEITV